jgi:4-amino-4-deoxy-L-arabinose transferase-like glycosyltransferase
MKQKMSRSIQLLTQSDFLKSGFGRAFSNAQNWLFVLSCVVYLFTRFWSLDRFPIYFFSDEAIQTVLASDLVNSNFFDGSGKFLPTFFQNVDKYSLGTTVYIQILPYLILGKSLIATRGISVLISMLGVLAVSFMMKHIFKDRYWWSAGLLLSITPAWFLHSRTAFEVVTMVSFYAVFIYCYLMCRSGSLGYLYAAIIFGALSFYSYNPGQVVVLITALLMVLLDWRYHWQMHSVNRKTLLLLVLVVMPFIRYLLESPGENLHHLGTLFSYWTQTLPISEKIGIYFSNYLFGLNPLYWYLPNQYDLSRHIMKGYGHILFVFAPLALIGLALVLRNLRSPTHRLVLAALLAAPTGAALVEISITRILMMVIPLTILAALGLSYCLQKLEEKIAIPRVVAWGLFSLLISVNIYMTADALRNGPVWFQDYGLQGMQYGGELVFSEVREYRQNHAETAIFVSSNWANNVEAMAHFFLPDPYLIYIVPIDSYISSYWPIDSDSLFVLTSEDFELAVKSHKFKEIRVEKELPYPNGKTGFYFARLKYVDNIQEIFAAEKANRHHLEEGNIQIGRQLVHVKFSQLDIGQLSDAFDGNPESVIRTKEANPLVLNLTFPEPLPLSEVSLRVGAAPTHVLVQIIGPNHQVIKAYSSDLAEAFENRDCNIEFGEPLLVNELIVTVERTDSSEPAHVHLWEVRLK